MKLNSYNSKNGEIKEILSLDELKKLKKKVSSVYVHDDIYEYERSGNV